MSSTNLVAKGDLTEKQSMEEKKEIEKTGRINARQDITVDFRSLDLDRTEIAGTQEVVCIKIRRGNC